MIRDLIDFVRMLFDGLHELVCPCTVDYGYVKYEPGN